MIEPEDHAPVRPEPDDPLPDYLHDPLEALGVEVGSDDGVPAPIRTPHQILLREYEHLHRAVHALVRVLERHGICTAVEVGVERDTLAAADAIDAAVGLTRRLLDEHLIAPLRLRVAEAERVHPCGCVRAARAEEEDSR